jgi:adenosylhomocysteine nucleosidase
MIGIIGAMQEEVQQLQAEIKENGLPRYARNDKAGNELGDKRIVKKASMSFYVGELCGKEVAVVQSGIGKVNAAICAQILVDEFGVDTLINTGIAGSLAAKVDIGDLVISRDAIHHDMDATIFGDAKGQVPRMDTLAFTADSRLVEIAVAANEKVNPDIHTFIGRIATGDQFISSKEEKQRIIDEFGALCVEMEGVAIAQTAYLNKIPYVIVRAISDKADDSATMDYPTFERQAIVHSVRLVKEILKQL